MDCFAKYRPNQFACNVWARWEWIGHIMDGIGVNWLDEGETLRDWSGCGYTITPPVVPQPGG